MLDLAALDAPPTLHDADHYRQLALELLSPPTHSSAWDWAVRHLRLRNGVFDPNRAGLMKHWYDIASARISGQAKAGDPWAHRTEEIYLSFITQLAKTTIMQVIAGWCMACHPREIGWYVTRNSDIRKIRERGFRPMIERTASLAAMLPGSAEARELVFANNLISIGGTLLYLLNGNLLDDLRSMPLPAIFMDEYNRLQDDIEDEGNPIDLAKTRQRTMPHTRLLMGGTSPGAITGHGWATVCGGSHERPMVQCPTCAGVDFLNDLQVVSGGDLELKEYPAEIILAQRLGRWACRHCGVMHGAMALHDMVRECARAQRWIAGEWKQSDDNPSGLWIPTHAELDGNGRLLRYRPPETVVRSGWANALYSRDITLDVFASQMVAKYHHGTPANKKTWTNTEACRPWIHVFTATTSDDIVAAAVRTYAAGSCPVAADLLILVFDQQGNTAGRFWYPYTIRAWKRGGESWLVSAGKAMSDIERDELEERMWPIGNERRSADVVVMDVANPNFRQTGYLWAADEVRRRVCVRGDVRLEPGETWRAVPPADYKSTNRTSRPADVSEWRLHPHHWRTELQERMMGTPGKPPWHLHADPPPFYLRSMTAEEQTVVMQRVVGSGYAEVVVWAPRVTQSTDTKVSVRSDNHWSDAEKMQIAIADILGLLKPVADQADTTTGKGKPSSDPADADTASDDFSGGVW